MIWLRLDATTCRAVIVIDALALLEWDHEGTCYASDINKHVDGIGPSAKFGRRRAALGVDICHKHCRFEKAQTKHLGHIRTVRNITGRAGNSRGGTIGGN